MLNFVYCSDGLKIRNSVEEFVNIMMAKNIPIMHSPFMKNLKINLLRIVVNRISSVLRMN